MLSEESNLTKKNYIFETGEKAYSQIPALQLLTHLGFQYLTPQQIYIERGKNKQNVLLEGILEKQLKRSNHIHYQNKTYHFTEQNIQSAIQTLKKVSFLENLGVRVSNQKVYDLLTLPKSFPQLIEGNTQSFDLYYIDWKHWEKNAFHMTAEFEVESLKSSDRIRCDIVLFVNGIPFVVIECKEFASDLDEVAIPQIQSYETKMPHLFVYIQMVMVIAGNDAKYATIGTNLNYWNIWKEPEKDHEIDGLIRKPLDSVDKENIFSSPFSELKTLFQEKENNQSRVLKKQDQTLYAICRPQRLLELIYYFTIFEKQQRKVARYQQYFVIQSALEKIQTFDEIGARKGGMIWQSQGSGKSLVMVLLLRNLILRSKILSPRFLVVSDRKNLDIQLSNTFQACSFEKKHATSSNDLFQLISQDKPQVIITLIHKFHALLKKREYRENSVNIFIFVDESHRSQFGKLAMSMRRIFPKACFFGFTGTPLFKKDKNNLEQFGNFLFPTYTTQQAISDGAIVPLIYESRLIKMNKKEGMDDWFELHTRHLNEKDTYKLKKKFSRVEKIYKSKPAILRQVFDINEHFSKHWKTTGFKGQLTVSNQSLAVLYHEIFQEIGETSTAVIISNPNKKFTKDYTTDSELTELEKGKVQQFWDHMMEKYENEEEYTRNILNDFDSSDDPKILICVNKLLEGFDVPRNTVFYLCRKLKEHTLLQAIARVNRPYDQKEFGYILDYEDTFKDLQKAITTYKALSKYDAEDLEEILIPLQEQLDELEKQYQTLIHFFDGIESDSEQYEQFLSDENKRMEFYQILANYKRLLAIAMSTKKFMQQTSPDESKEYLQLMDQMEILRKKVRFRYADSERKKFSMYDTKIKKVLDRHLYSTEVEIIKKQHDLFKELDEEGFQDESIANANFVREHSPTYGAVRQADFYMYGMKKDIEENMEKDPIFHKKFSVMVQETIDLFQKGKIDQEEYFRKAKDLKQKFESNEQEDIPKALQPYQDLSAYYRAIFPIFKNYVHSQEKLEKHLTDLVFVLQKNLKKYMKTDFSKDSIAKNKLINKIDDYLYDVVGKKWNISLSTEEMNLILSKVLYLVEKNHR